MTTTTDWGREDDTVYSYVIQAYTYNGYTGPEPREYLYVEPEYGPEESRLGNVIVNVDGRDPYIHEDFPWPSSITKRDRPTGRTYHRIYADVRGEGAFDRVDSFEIHPDTRHPGATLRVGQITNSTDTNWIASGSIPTDTDGFYSADLSVEDHRARIQILVVAVTPENGSEETRHYYFAAACWNDVDSFRDSDGNSVPMNARCSEENSLSLEDTRLNLLTSSN